MAKDPLSPFRGKKTLTESEIKLMLRRVNSGMIDKHDVLALMPEEGWGITAEQTRKGIAWLKDQWKTPRGIERKNNPFGYREQDVIENFKEFRLIDFYPLNMVGTYFGPVYEVRSKNGNHFDYVGVAGPVKIIG